MQAARWRRRPLMPASKGRESVLADVGAAMIALLVLMAGAAALTGCGVAAKRAIRPAASAVQQAKYPPVAISAGHCPRRQPRGVPATRKQAARHELAPRGITWIEICRYGPITATGSHLQAMRTLRSRSAIQALQRRLNALPAPPPGAVNCASDDGAEIWLGLAYRTHTQIIESVELQGCRDVSNGSLVAAASGYGERNDRPPSLKQRSPWSPSIGDPLLGNEDSIPQRRARVEACRGAANGRIGAVRDPARRPGTARNPRPPAPPIRAPSSPEARWRRVASLRRPWSS